MKLVKLLAIFIVALVVSSVTLSNHSLDDSDRVADLNRELEVLEHQNTILRAELAEVGSLTQVASRIEELGFVENPPVVTLTIPGNVALR